MKQKRWQRLGAFFDIPDDITMHVVRVTMVGRNALLVENHNGIIEYTSELLRIKVDDGELCVSGKGLSLAIVEREQVRIAGLIVAVRYA